MLQFSANLGFLWADLPLPQAITAAAAAGFDAVECHWPYATPAGDVARALDEAGVGMCALNTAPGDVQAGEFGLAALPGREAEAREATDRALDYARAIGAGAVHVMAGKAQGPEAEAAFVENLTYALDRAGGRTVLIEPLNPFDVPGYFLSNTAQAVDLITRIGAPKLKLMFDCYHVARTEKQVQERLKATLEHVGHIQFASVPWRGRPDTGDLDYGALFDQIDALGWNAPLGAEYRPEGATENSLGGMARYR